MLDDVEDLSALDDATIVFAIFLGQVRREEVEIGLPFDRLERRAELRAKLLVGEREPAFQVLAEDHLRDGLDQRVVEDLGLEEDALRPAARDRFGAE